MDAVRVIEAGHLNERHAGPAVELLRRKDGLRVQHEVEVGRAELIVFLQRFALTDLVDGVDSRTAEQGEQLALRV